MGHIRIALWVSGSSGSTGVTHFQSWITSLLPINKTFLSFNTNQKPHIKSLKSGDFENKNYTRRSPDPFSSRPNIKEEKMVWLHETRSP